MQEIAAALSTGAVDAGMLTSPENFVLENQGYPKLKAALDYRIPYTMSGLAASQRFASANEEAMRRLMRAHVEGIALFLNDKETTRRSIAKLTKIEDPRILDQAYEHVAGAMERVPYVDRASIQTVLDQLASQVPTAQSARADDFLDNRFVRELDESGFIRRLYE